MSIKVVGSRVKASKELIFMGGCIDFIEPGVRVVGQTEYELDQKTEVVADIIWERTVAVFLKQTFIQLPGNKQPRFFGLLSARKWAREQQESLLS